MRTPLYGGFLSVYGGCLNQSGFTDFTPFEPLYNAHSSIVNLCAVPLDVHYKVDSRYMDILPEIFSLSKPEFLVVLNISKYRGPSMSRKGWQSLKAGLVGYFIARVPTLILTQNAHWNDFLGRKILGKGFFMHECTYLGQPLWMHLIEIVLFQKGLYRILYFSILSLSAIV